MTGQTGSLSKDDAGYAAPMDQIELGAANDGAAPAAAIPAPHDSGANSRLKDLLRQKQIADTLAAHSAAEAAALRGTAQTPPRPQDYTAPEDYTRAVAEQAVREVGAGILARQAARAQELAAKAAREAWTEAAAEFRQRVPDFDAVAFNPAVTITPVMADALHESNRGAEIAYYLGKNPVEAERIAALPPVSQATAIARLETRIAGIPAVSRAPEPVATLSGRGGSGGKPLEDMDFEEYRRTRGY